MSADPDAGHHIGLYGRKALPAAFYKRVLRWQQSQLYAHFARAFPPRPEWRVLDLGVNAGASTRDEYFFEVLYPHPSRITAAGLESPEQIEGLFPAIEYHRTARDEIRLPFEDQAFDVVFCNAVIEHVGDQSRQREFLQEILRLGRRAFVTTPNRWYPMEFHTMLPLLHWLPSTAYRRLYRGLGFSFFAAEQNLNLLDEASLLALLPAGERARARIAHHRFLGPISNLLLVVGERR